MIDPDPALGMCACGLPLHYTSPEPVDFAEAGTGAFGDEVQKSERPADTLAPAEEAGRGVGAQRGRVSVFPVMGRHRIAAIPRIPRSSRYLQHDWA